VSPAWKAAVTLDLVERGALVHAGAENGTNGRPPVAVVCATLDDVRDLSVRAPEIAHAVRAVLAPYIPSSLVTLFSAAGIAAIRIEGSAALGLRGQKTIALPAPSQWPERQATTVVVGAAKLPLTWLALGTERAWATGAAKPAPAPPARAARS
jgi:aconitate hydratase